MPLPPMVTIFKKKEGISSGNVDFKTDGQCHCDRVVTDISKEREMPSVTKISSTMTMPLLRGDKSLRKKKHPSSSDERFS